jgi:hypothetical protein
MVSLHTAHGLPRFTTCTLKIEITICLYNTHGILIQPSFPPHNFSCKQDLIILPYPNLCPVGATPSPCMFSLIKKIMSKSSPVESGLFWGNRKMKSLFFGSAGVFLKYPLCFCKVPYFHLNVSFTPGRHWELKWIMCQPNSKNKLKAFF